MGSADNGRSAGKLYIAEKNISKWLAHPASLHLSSSFQKQPRTVTEKILGQVVSRTWYS